MCYRLPSWNWLALAKGFQANLQIISKQPAISSCRRYQYGLAETTAVFISVTFSLLRLLVLRWTTLTYNKIIRPRSIMAVVGCEKICSLDTLCVCLTKATLISTIFNSPFYEFLIQRRLGHPMDSEWVSAVAALLHPLRGQLKILPH